MTSTSHRDCTHPATKAARTKCRKLKAQDTAALEKFLVDNQIYHDTYVVPYRETEALRKEWDAEVEKFAEAHRWSAEQNADDTMSEEGFEYLSKRWYQVALSTLHFARDTATPCWDPKDPEKGQLVELKNCPGNYWVDQIRYANGWADAVTVIDNEGNRKEVSPADIKDNR